MSQEKYIGLLPRLRRLFLSYRWLYEEYWSRKSIDLSGVNKPTIEHKVI